MTIKKSGLTKNYTAFSLFLTYLFVYFYAARLRMVSPNCELNSTTKWKLLLLIYSMICLWFIFYRARFNININITSSSFFIVYESDFVYTYINIGGVVNLYSWQTHENNWLRQQAIHFIHSFIPLSFFKVILWSVKWSDFHVFITTPSTDENDCPKLHTIPCFIIQCKSVEDH